MLATCRAKITRAIWWPNFQQKWAKNSFYLLQDSNLWPLTLQITPLYSWPPGFLLSTVINVSFKHLKRKTIELELWNLNAIQGACENLVVISTPINAAVRCCYFCYVWQACCCCCFFWRKHYQSTSATAAGQPRITKAATANGCVYLGGLTKTWKNLSSFAKFE